jgi:TRAP-type C4-dicarboxylate transport system permease small subunit
MMSGNHMRVMDRQGIYGILERLRIAQLRLASVALIVMMGVTLADVFLRYLFNSPIRGAYELVEAMLVVFVFHGMSTVFLQRRNIVIDLIDSVVPRAIVTALIRVSDALTVVTLALFAYAMLTPALQAYAYGDVKMDLQVPIWWMWTVALAGMAGAIVCALGALGALVAPAEPRHDNEPV